MHFLLGLREFARLLEHRACSLIIIKASCVRSPRTLRADSGAAMLLCAHALVALRVGTRRSWMGAARAQILHVVVRSRIVATRRAGGYPVQLGSMRWSNATAAPWAVVLLHVWCSCSRVSAWQLYKCVVLSAC